MEADRDAILKALEHVIDPELRRPVTELDMVRDIEIDGGDVSVTIALTVAGCPLRDELPGAGRASTSARVDGVERGPARLRRDERPTRRRRCPTKLRGGVEDRRRAISARPRRRA